MITYCTCSGATPAFSRAPRIATAPRSAPLNPARDPCRRPIGVPAPATITDDADCWLGTVCLQGGLARLRCTPPSQPNEGRRVAPMSDSVLDADLFQTIDHVGVSVADLDRAI